MFIENTVPYCMDHTEIVENHLFQILLPFHLHIKKFGICRLQFHILQKKEKVKNIQKKCYSIVLISINCKLVSSLNQTKLPMHLIHINVKAISLLFKGK